MMLSDRRERMAATEKFFRAAQYLYNRGYHAELGARVTQGAAQRPDHVACLFIKPGTVKESHIACLTLSMNSEGTKVFVLLETSCGEGIGESGLACDVLESNGIAYGTGSST